MQVLMMLEMSRTPDDYKDLHNFFIDTKLVSDISIKETPPEKGKLSGGVIEGILISMAAALIYDLIKKAIEWCKSPGNEQQVIEIKIVDTDSMEPIKITRSSNFTRSEIKSIIDNMKKE